MAPDLTADRVRFVVKEHARLLRKLRRMPAAHRSLAVTRLPDVAAGETLTDVVRPQIPGPVAAVMEAIAALEPERKRIEEIYFQLLQGDATGPGEGDVAAVLDARDEIERASPRLKRVREALERQRGGAARGPRKP